MTRKWASPATPLFHRFFLLGGLLFLGGCAQKEPIPAKADATELTSAMKNGAEYMARASKPSGEFVYLANLPPGVSKKGEYNVLRHAGALYPMADYYQHQGDPTVKAALVRSATFLKQKYMKPIPGEKDMLAIWSLPSDEKGGAFEVKLGGIGLGLVGLVGVEEAAPGTTPLKILRQLGNAVLFMQEENGSLYSKYDPAKGGKQAHWDSLYYPGEAALGLAMLAEIETDPAQKKRWINAAFRAIGFLARERETTGQVPPDHWVLIATARLWPLHVYSDHSVSKAVLLKHAISIANVLVHDGALRDVRSTPIATRLEGLLAALTFLPPEQKELRGEIEVEIEKGIQFLLKTQVTDGPLKGGIVRAYTAPGEKKVEERADEIRIDYVQHTLSAWLEYARQQGIFKTQTIKTS